MCGFKAAIKPVQKIGGNIGKPKTVVDSDYTLLENKPCINGVTVEGNKSFEDYGLLFDGETIIEENGILKVADGSHGHTVENIDGLQEALDAAADHVANEDNPHKVTKTQLDLENVENKSSADIRGELTSGNVTDALGYIPPTANEVGAALDTKADKTALQTVESSLTAHAADNGNPHKVTKSQLGLGNVENKSSAVIRGELTSGNVTDALGYIPPTANEVGAALDTKADKTALQTVESSLTAHAADNGNPHKVTKSQLGLGNVENKSSADIRGELTKGNVTAALGYTPPTTNTTYGAATQSANGLMSFADKKKLDGIAAGAQVNSITGVKGGAESSYRTGQVNVTAANIGLGNVENKSSATIRGELTKDNVTAALGYTPPTTNTTYGAATQSANGLMSSADKKKLDGIAAGAQVNSITGVKGSAESSYRTGQVNITAANIGLGNVENKSSSTIRGELTKDNVTAALGYTPSSESGAAETVTSTIRRQLRPSDLFRIY